jgi:hypothetical protein
MERRHLELMASRILSASRFRLDIDEQSVIARDDVVWNLYFRDECVRRDWSNSAAREPGVKASLISRRLTNEAKVERNAFYLGGIRPVQFDFKPKKVSWLSEFGDLLSRDGDARHHSNCGERKKVFHNTKYIMPSRASTSACTSKHKRLHEQAQGRCKHVATSWACALVNFRSHW